MKEKELTVGDLLEFLTGLPDSTPVVIVDAPLDDENGWKSAKTGEIAEMVFNGATEEWEEPRVLSKRAKPRTPRKVLRID